MMSRGTYLRSTVSFLASSSQLRWRVLNLDAARLSVPAATGGNALINTDCPSLTTCWSVSLMILGAPALYSPPRGANWWMSGSRWYFHIDTAIDDCAPGTSPIDQLVTRPRLERVLLMCLWLYEGLGRQVETDVGERWSLSSKFYGKNSWIVLLWRVRSEIYRSKDSKGMMYYIYVYVFLANTFLKIIHRDFDKPININW